MSVFDVPFGASAFISEITQCDLILASLPKLEISYMSSNEGRAGAKKWCIIFPGTDNMIFLCTFPRIK